MGWEESTEVFKASYNVLIIEIWKEPGQGGAEHPLQPCGAVGDKSMLDVEMFSCEKDTQTSSRDFLVSS